ncbi:MAG TPA: flagellar filament capping protein FliD [Blastococcus sp.]|jgi:flagellar capping protein FliD|nr:flagellar filament capping protein FliD [Blastococcus sp.]
MAGMSISGLVSGLDTTTLISQLMQLERQPQTQLKTKLTDTKADASAYRTVNSVFTTLQSAAESLTKATTWAPVKATSSATTVSASATAGAATGQVSFRVDTLAASHVLISGATWTPSASAMELTVSDKDADTPAKTIPIAANATLDQTVTAINAANAGVTATAVSTGTGFRLQLTSAGSGADGEFTVSGGPAFSLFTQAADAKLTVGAGGPYSYEVTSTSNTFTDLMPGTTFTVSKKDETATVTVASDPAALTSAIQSLVTAANAAITNINTYSDNSAGSTAVLRGDSSLRALAGQIADAVAYAVGGDGSAAVAGLQLTRDGKIAFDSAAFTAQLKADPVKTQRLLNGSGTGDAAVPGVAQRLLAVAKYATDTTTGSLVNLAQGKDAQATELQKRIDDWDLRLELRQQTLTRQFTAMESALGTMQNQSGWLSSQLGSLPTWS